MYRTGVCGKVHCIPLWEDIIKVLTILSAGVKQPVSKEMKLNTVHFQDMKMWIFFPLKIPKRFLSYKQEFKEFHIANNSVPFS